MPVTAITSLPTFSTPSEHSQLTSSTPSSFDQLPPVGRLQVSAVFCRLDPPFKSDHGTVWEQGRGQLFVNDDALYFYTDESSSGIKIPYPVITLHALSRSLESAKDQPCIYCQLDDNEGLEEYDEEAEQDGEGMREFTIIPDDQELLETIFESLSYCASLHPSASVGGLPFDPSSMSDDDPEGVYDDAEDESEMTEAGRAALAHLESIVDWPAHVPQPESKADKFQFAKVSFGRPE